MNIVVQWTRENRQKCCDVYSTLLRSRLSVRVGAATAAAIARWILSLFKRVEETSFPQRAVPRVDGDFHFAGFYIDFFRLNLETLEEKKFHF